MFSEIAIVAASRAIGAFFEFLASPEGQLQAKEWREDRGKLKADISAAGAWFKSMKR
jgi:hypothetical protein